MTKPSRFLNTQGQSDLDTTLKRQSTEVIDCFSEQVLSTVSECFGYGPNPGAMSQSLSSHC